MEERGLRCTGRRGRRKLEVCGTSLDTDNANEGEMIEGTYASRTSSLGFFAPSSPLSLFSFRRASRCPITRLT